MRKKGRTESFPLILPIPLEFPGVLRLFAVGLTPTTRV